VKTGVEIAVRDPSNGGRGWSYVFVFDDPPPLSLYDEVHDAPDLVIDGPLRVIRRTRVRVPIAFWPDATMESTIQFLPDRIVIEGPDRLPRRVRHFARDLRLRLSWDFTAPPGATVHAAPVPSGVAVDGRTDPIEAALDGAPSYWWALALPRDRALVGVFENLDLSGGAPTLPVLFYRDDAEPDPPESYPGSRPGVGWRFDRPGADDPAGTPNRVHLFVLGAFHPGSETGPLDTATRPLEVVTGPGLGD
jgi:hypothetical protein